VARVYVVKVTDDLVALILLQVLVRDDRVARLRAGVDAAEDLRLILEVIAVAVKVRIPVGELDDHLRIWVHGFGRTRHQIARDLIHEVQTEL